MKALGAAFSLVLAAGTAQAQVSVTKTGAFTRMQCATPSISTAYSAGQQVGPGIVMGNVFRADGPNYGGTLMSISTKWASLDSMKQMIEMGMEAGMAAAMGQMDELLA